MEFLSKLFGTGANVETPNTVTTAGAVATQPQTTATSQAQTAAAKEASRQEASAAAQPEGRSLKEILATLEKVVTWLKAHINKAENVQAATQPGNTAGSSTNNDAAMNQAITSMLQDPALLKLLAGNEAGQTTTSVAKPETQKPANEAPVPATAAV